LPLPSATLYSTYIIIITSYISYYLRHAMIDVATIRVAAISSYEHIAIAAAAARLRGSGARRLMAAQAARYALSARAPRRQPRRGARRGAWRRVGRGTAALRFA